MRMKKKCKGLMKESELSREMEGYSGIYLRFILLIFSEVTCRIVCSFPTTFTCLVQVGKGKKLDLTSDGVFAKMSTVERERKVGLWRYIVREWLWWWTTKSKVGKEGNRSNQEVAKEQYSLKGYSYRNDQGSQGQNLLNMMRPEYLNHWRMMAGIVINEGERLRELLGTIKRMSIRELRTLGSNNCLEHHRARPVPGEQKSCHHVSSLRKNRSFHEKEGKFREDVEDAWDFNDWLSSRGCCKQVWGPEFKTTYGNEMVCLSLCFKEHPLYIYWGYYCLPKHIPDLKVQLHNTCPKLSLTVLHPQSIDVFFQLHRQTI